MSTTVTLGNPNPAMQVRRAFIGSDGTPVLDGDGAPVTEQIAVPAPHLNQSVTTVVMRDGFDDSDEVDLALSSNNDRTLTGIARILDTAQRKYAIGVLEIDGVMGAHAFGDAPAWVDSDDPEFAAAIAAYFGCPVGEPTMLLTTGGRDALHAQHLSTSAPPATFNYMAVTANSTAPAAGNTTLSGEITTAGGGLLRVQATYAHTAGTNTTTLTKTFTANGSDSLPVTLAKIGVFNASSAGTMGYETLLNATATLTTSGDNVAITETVTLG